MTHTASHIIISSSIGEGGPSGSGMDEIEIRYIPSANLSPEQVGKEVAKRLKWIHQFGHTNAAET